MIVGLESGLGSRFCARFGFIVGLVACLSVAGASRAVADSNDEARAYLEKAKGAFALSHYAQAAEYFEKAFELRSDPALLYNAAQSHRLAGNKERALALYKNYLHVYGNDERAAHIEKQIEELKRSIEHDRKELPSAQPPAWSAGGPPGKGSPSRTPASPAATTPPPEPPKPLPVTPGPAPVEPLASNTGSAAPQAVPTAVDTQPSGGATADLTRSASPGETESTPLTRKPWFWVAVGGGVAAVVTTVLLVVLSKTNDPSPTLGSASGN